MTQLLEWDAGDGPGRRAAQMKAVIDAGTKTFCEAIEREASSMEKGNAAVAVELVTARLSGRGADAVPFLLGFQIGVMMAEVRNLMQVMNLVDMAELGYEAACEAEGDTLEEAYADAIMRHLEAMMEARS